MFSGESKPATLFKKRLWHRCFPVNFAKFLRIPFPTEHIWRMLLYQKRISNAIRHLWWTQFYKNSKQLKTVYKFYKRFHLRRLATSEIFLYMFLQKQPSGALPWKRCCENMQQICRRTPTPKWDFNKLAKQLYWNCTSAWVFTSKFAVYFQNTFS